MTPQEFIKKWAANERTERAASQTHFNDLCDLVGEPKPLDVDATGEKFTFEKGGATAAGGHGWADVWKKGAFAWEYKGPGKDLNAAYLQLKKYADMLENPPLLITSDTKRIEIHTNFTSTVKRVHVLDLTDLADPAKRELLKHAFSDPERLRPGITRHMVTKAAAESFSQLAHHLQAKGFDPQRVAHFLNRLIFCMFAEDVGLLPNQIFTKLATASVAHPEAFEANARQLFGGMAKGGAVAFEVIDWFNGGLFDDDATLPLDEAELKIVLKCAALDWSNIEPSIFGTLFERGLDPDKRSQQGAHYTDPDTIMKIVGPVVLEPWQREWEAERAEIVRLIEKAKKTVSEAAKQRYFAFLERLVNFRVLDPACGSGNFLYLALRCLKDFEKRVILDAELLGLPVQFPRVGPEAVLGIEVNPYAAELARVTIWIGELQWMLENGFSAAKDPILKALDQIERRDAVLNDDGTEPKWPRADVIVGNPPFLGDRKIIRGLGSEYAASLRQCYAGRVANGMDLVCYWFLKAAQEVGSGRASRAGLVATQAIRGVRNHKILERIRRDASIFTAWSNVPWVNEGADVRVAMICFSKDQPDNIVLDGIAVTEILSDLSSPGSDGTDFTLVAPLVENADRAFQGIIKSGPFDIGGDVAREMLAAPMNVNGRTNADVVRPWVNGVDLTRRAQDHWIIDFGLDLTELQAAKYEMPFAYVSEVVRPVRQENSVQAARDTWWRLWCPRPELRTALRGLTRYIATSIVAKHRLFVFVPWTILPSNKVVAVASDSVVTFGILSSRIHGLWAGRKSTRHGVGNDPSYNPATCFQTFPFPEGLAPSVATDMLEAAANGSQIAHTATNLLSQREAWLNPPNLIHIESEVVPEFPPRLLPKDSGSAKQLAKRTLTNLYNANPAWLQHAHAELDEAVAAAYGWEWPLSDDEILTRLFRLNRERSVREGGARH